MLRTSLCASAWLTLCCIQAFAVDNVSTSADPKVRVAKMKSLVGQVVDDLDGAASASDKQKFLTFLMRVAYHEGSQLTARRQNGGGPGRSFFQFEPGKAKDGVDYAVQKGWLNKLSSVGGTTDNELKSAASTLKLGAPWPSGNLIEKLLGDKADAIDIFAIYLTRIVLKKVPAAIPESLDEQAEYWAKNWKIKFDSDADRTKKIQQFKTNATELDGLL